ncbi:MAG: phenylacetate--CoA ligase [Eubacteriaceae bacterium]|nr:phenylacetate--CoA ligase [Eubacteriaceae bacterium]MDD4508858.1 phenylacetate--CoA ligase [Eubacteriaceae bacterium]
MIWSLKETLDREQIKAIQLKKLKKTVKYAYKKVPYYQEKFKSAGIHPNDIQSLDDLNKIPFTTKEDLRRNYPFGMFAVPRKKIVRYHASSGTTGNPTVVGYTRHDMKVWRECVARMVSMAGVNKNDTAQISFGYGLFTGALGLQQGLEKVGAGIVPMSSGNSKKQIKIMKDFGVTTLIATPSYGLHLSEVAKSMGLDPKEDLHLRNGVFGSEASTEAMRKKLNEAWGMFATENYGMSELMGPGVSGECRELNGMHINEDYFIAEIINPKTGEVLPEGEMGELVVTPLFKEALPVLRYRTKDITSLDSSPCACGRTTMRMSKIGGRTDDMLIISGVNVFPSQIEEILLSIDGIGSNYLITVDKKGYLDKINIDVEVIDSSLLDSVSRLDNLMNTIKTQMHTTLGIHPGIHLVEPLSMKRSEGKAQRVIDLRKDKE